jgi:hypothetical protein
MLITDMELVQHQASIEGGIIVIDGHEMLSPEEFVLAEFNVITYTSQERAELERLGILG